jgi:hypothetical protein
LRLDQKLVPKKDPTIWTPTTQTDEYMKTNNNPPGSWVAPVHKMGYVSRKKEA